MVTSRDGATGDGRWELDYTEAGESRRSCVRWGHTEPGSGERKGKQPQKEADTV